MIADVGLEVYGYVPTDEVRKLIERCGGES